jgi:L-2-hydroxyglutarate oxidase
VQGAREMVAFAAAHGIAHEICGKVVVATLPDELPRLAELQPARHANGVPGLE